MPVSLGDVYAITFARIAHPKYCVVTGLTDSSSVMLTVFINTSIDYIRNVKPHLLPLQVPITQNNNRFLSHDSYVGCEHYEIFSQQKIDDLTDNGYCRSLGQLNANDLATIKQTVIDSELLSPEELQYYFQIPMH